LKQRIDVEKLLRWAYVHELPKRPAPDGARSYAADLFMLGGGGGGSYYDGAPPEAVMYGAPHPDALMLDHVVRRDLEPARLTMAMAKELLGELASWLTRDVMRPLQTGMVKKKDGRDIAGIVVSETVERETQLEARELSPASLVPLHARLGNRPNWATGEPRIRRVNGSNGKPLIRGITKGKRYGDGAHCVLALEPSVDVILRARFEYVVWWMALVEIAERCRMTEHFALPPSAPPFPWRGGEQQNPRSMGRFAARQTALTTAPASACCGLAR
jgi:hypothetical protein